MILISVSFKKIMQSNAYTMIVLGNEKKQFPIYTDPIVGANLQKILTQEPIKRPYTHHLIETIFNGCGLKVKQVTLYRIDETIYFAKLFLEWETEGITHIFSIDSRPSDALTLALMHDAPLFCEKEVFETAISCDMS